MKRSKIWWSLRTMTLAAAVALALGSVAWGQSYGRYDDDDYYRRDDAREQGHHNGYQDGWRAGRYDAERGHRFKFKTDDWEDSRGFERWMGDHGHYKHAYREAYERGYRQAYGNSGYRRDRDDYRWHDRDDWR